MAVTKAVYTLKPVVESVIESYAKKKVMSGTITLALTGTLICYVSERSKHIRVKKNQKKAAKKKSKQAKRKQAPRIGVNAKFFARMRYIMRIVIPTWKSKEMLVVVAQTFVLFSRTMLSIHIAKLMARGLKSVTERSWTQFYACWVDFAWSGALASVVNSALVFLKFVLANCTRKRLTGHVHDMYLENRNYYKTVLAQDSKGLDNADQRIVEDLNQFAETAADLYQRTFKPLLDAVLGTGSLINALGWKGVATLYGYFLISAVGLKAIVPAFGKMITQQTALEGDFRRSHARLIQHAEEVAFLEGGDREKEILNRELESMVEHKGHMLLLRFRQGIVDQWAIKYFASCVGFPVLALPFLWAKNPGSPSQIAADFRYSDVLMRNTSSAIQDLMMMYKRTQKLAGYTSRVSELLEALEKNRKNTDDEKTNGSNKFGDEARFDGVDIYTPEKTPRLLLKDVNVEFKRGDNVIVTGPNGAGKTSLFRVLAGLWKHRSGVVTRPQGAQVLFVPQNPYLVSGTLRDQIAYPLNKAQAQAKAKGFDFELDDLIVDCLTRVGLLKLVLPELGLDRRHHDWADVLSGGEKQRIGLARLFFHRPTYAVLDESTSAVNVDEEGPIYNHAIKLGITVFSIAHRLALRRFHQYELHLEGDGTGAYSYTRIQHDSDEPTPQKSPEMRMEDSLVIVGASDSPAPAATTEQQPATEQA